MSLLQRAGTPQPAHLARQEFTWLILLRVVASRKQILDGLTRGQMLDGPTAIAHLSCTSVEFDLPMARSPGVSSPPHPAKFPEVPKQFPRVPKQVPHIPEEFPGCSAPGLTPTK